VIIILGDVGGSISADHVVRYVAKEIATDREGWLSVI